MVDESVDVQRTPSHRAPPYLPQKRIGRANLGLYGALHRNHALRHHQLRRADAALVRLVWLLEGLDRAQVRVGHHLCDIRHHVCLHLLAEYFSDLL